MKKVKINLPQVGKTTRMPQVRIDPAVERIFSSKVLYRAAMSSALLGRSDIMKRMGYQYGDNRDLYAALGYPLNIQWSDYKGKYDRQDIASRIIDAPPNATWRGKPDITDDEEAKNTSAFEDAWNLLEKEHRVISYLRRADKLARVGRYGILLMGFDDGEELEEERPPQAKELLYLMPYGETDAEIHLWDEDQGSSRYGRPTMYKVNMAVGNRQHTKKVLVHHSRVIHIAENVLDNDVYGKPVLQNIFNRLMNLELIVGGSSEMFWRGAFPGYAFVPKEDYDIDPTDTELADEIEEYIHGLKRYMRLTGMDVQPLSSQVASPQNHFDMIMKVISGTTGIPTRILLGSERGELASTQDKKNWAERIDERRQEHAEPTILRPFIDTMIDCGILPAPKSNGKDNVNDYKIEWKSLYSPDDKEAASTALTKTQALAAYSNAQGADILLPPQFFLEKVMGFTSEEVGEIEAVAEKLLEEEQKQLEEERKIAEEEFKRQQAQKIPPGTEQPPINKKEQVPA